MAATTAKTLVVRNGTLIDGSGKPAARNDAIVIEGNRIKSVGALPPDILLEDRRNVEVILTYDTKHAAARLLKAQIHLARQQWPAAQSDLEAYLRQAPKANTAAPTHPRIAIASKVGCMENASLVMRPESLVSLSDNTSTKGLTWSLAASPGMAANASFASPSIDAPSEIVQIVTRSRFAT